MKGQGCGKRMVRKCSADQSSHALSAKMYVAHNARASAMLFGCYRGRLLVVVCIQADAC